MRAQRLTPATRHPPGPTPTFKPDPAPKGMRVKAVPMETGPRVGSVLSRKRLKSATVRSPMEVNAVKTGPVWDIRSRAATARVPPRRRRRSERARLETRRIRPASRLRLARVPFSDSSMHLRRALRSGGAFAPTRAATDVRHLGGHSGLHLSRGLCMDRKLVRFDCRRAVLSDAAPPNRPRQHTCSLPSVCPRRILFFVRGVAPQGSWTVV